MSWLSDIGGLCLRTANLRFWPPGNFGLPIAKKELRALLRQRRYFWLQLFYLAVIACGVGVLVLTAEVGDYSSEVVGRRLFAVFFVAQTALIYMIFPALAATTISGERVEKSLDLLLISDLRPAEIIWGKFLGVFGNCCCFLVVSVPLLATCLLFGGVALSDVLEHYSLLLIQSALIAIFGLWASATARGPVRSIIVAYMASLAIGVGAVALLVGFFEEASSLSILDLFNANLGAFGTFPWITATLVAVALFFCLFFVLAVRPLHGPEGNLSTPVRLWTLALGLSLIWGSGELQSFALPNGPCGPGGPTTAWAVGWYTSLSTLLWTVLFVVAVLFSGEPTEVPRRVVFQLRGRPLLGVVGWLLLPGGGRGPAFAALCIVATWLSLDAMLAVGGAASLEPYWETGARVGELLRATWLVLAVSLSVYCALAFLLAACGLSGGANWWSVVGVAVIANLYPIFWAAVRREVLESDQASPLSLVSQLRRLWNSRPRDPSGDLSSSWPIDAEFHSALAWGGGVATVLFISALVTLRRRRLPVFRFVRPPRTASAATTLLVCLAGGVT